MWVVIVTGEYDDTFFLILIRFKIDLLVLIVICSTAG
jgi:hypothetical protein